ncbi:MAG TPA: xanthine dehydrogenase family protein subunit M [Tahibacter sp.]|uniref:FAD binding domain-containing protein n=1 Tax=Tahibacter sp. TaxID=2056211 RepID=UPI002CC256AA|nr:xanthine dehydrogenase family protein subunit M [Tahibacter sp.]HSX59819.1 xanthine dehydrogenase family protein subunit M [Tahibacter sp.]
MMPFVYDRPTSIGETLALMEHRGHQLLGGGTNLVDLMRKGIAQPSRLVDVTALSGRIDAAADGSLMIGAAARNSEVAAHPLVRANYPMLARAILAGASAQIRNMATVGGNLMQRTRCLYFQDAAAARCNKRVPGSGCDAIGGFNRYHAIVGTSPACIAAHPSDMCVALAALDATVHVTGPGGTRAIALTGFHRLPEDRPDRETELASDEIIVGVEVPAPSRGARSTYRKVRDRASYAFALVSVAASLELHDDRIAHVRLAFGGIAPKPWRALRAEAALLGERATPHALAAAVATEFVDAAPQRDNAFKVDLAIRTATAVLTQLGGSAP